MTLSEYEDDILLDNGVSSAVLATNDGSLVDGYEFRIGDSVFVGVTISQVLTKALAQYRNPAVRQFIFLMASVAEETEEEGVPLRILDERMLVESEQE